MEKVPDSSTDVVDFIGALGAGIFQRKIAAILSQTAQGTVLYGKGSKVGRVTIDFTMKQLGDNEQVVITHKVSHSTPTARGKKSEEDAADTPMFVHKGGKLCETAPREEASGQFSLVQGK